jgi:hypothetical protein
MRNQMLGTDGTKFWYSKIDRSISNDGSALGIAIFHFTILILEKS